MSKKLFEKFGDRAALESIRFQSGALFNELTGIFTAFQKEKYAKKDIAKAPEIEAIEKCIKHHTNISINFIVEDDGPMVMCPMINKNHPFIQDMWRQFFDDADVKNQLKKADGIVSGTVSIQESRVGGVFAEIVSDLYIPYDWAVGNFKNVTPEECAAVTLHELGHLFTYYEFIDRAVTTNQVLASLSRGIAESETADERTVLLIAANKALKLKDDGIDELAKSKNADVVSSVILSRLAEKSRSELGINIYDMTSWEALADDFSARHQAGKHLITALDKLYRGSAHMSYRGTSMYLFMEVVKIVLLLGGIAASATPFGFYGVMTYILLVARDGDVEIYDEPEARIRRVKHQLMEAMKDKTISKERIAQYQEDLVAIDKILAGVKDKRQFFDAALEFIIPSKRRQRNTINTQQELEKIANNQLFEKAASFRTMNA